MYAEMENIQVGFGAVHIHRDTGSHFSTLTDKPSVKRSAQLFKAIKTE